MNMKLTKELALQKVDEIRIIASDDESAHCEEDRLHYWFIDCVSTGMYTIDEAIEIANIVKSTANIDFDRWYA